MTNFYAVVMQSSGMTPLAQWLVIGLSVASLMVAVVASGPQQLAAWKVRVMGGLAVALVLAVLASNASALTIIDCTVMMTNYWWIFWGC